MPGQHGLITVLETPCWLALIHRYSTRVLVLDTFIINCGLNGITLLLDRQVTLNVGTKTICCSRTVGVLRKDPWNHCCGTMAWWVSWLCMASSCLFSVYGAGSGCFLIRSGKELSGW